MNAQDRKELADIKEKLEALQSHASHLCSDLQALADAEQDKFDNMSEGLQASEQGQRIQEAAEKLDEAAQFCSDGQLSDALEAIDDEVLQ